MSGAQDACKALPVSEAAAILDMDLRYVEEGGNGKNHRCTYLDVPPNSGPAKELLIMFVDLDGPAFSRFKQFRTTGTKVIGGLGDEALELAIGHIIVRFGQYTVEVGATRPSFTGEPRVVDTTRVVALLKVFLPRLPK